MCAMRMKADLTGERELLRKFDRLGKKAGKKVLRKATRAGTAPLVKAAKRNAPKESGELKKDLTQKQKFYSNTGTQVGIVGAKKRKDGKSRSTWILHLVEEGTAAHVISPKNKKALSFDMLGIKKRKANRKRDGKGRFVSGDEGLPPAQVAILGKVKHPGTTGSHFLRRSAETTQSESAKRFAEKMAAEVQAEAKKL